MPTVYMDSLDTFCQKYFLDKGVPLSPQDKLLMKYRKKTWIQKFLKI